MKEELGKHFDNQSWNNGADAARAIENLKEPVYIESNEPPLPTRFINNTNKYGTIKTEKDPEYEGKYQRYKVLTTMFATDHREWKYNAKNWKANKSHMLAILLLHCAKDLTPRIK